MTENSQATNQNVQGSSLQGGGAGQSAGYGGQNAASQNDLQGQNQVTVDSVGGESAGSGVSPQVNHSAVYFGVLLVAVGLIVLLLPLWNKLTATTSRSAVPTPKPAAKNTAVKPTAKKPASKKAKKSAPKKKR